jgi:hypothetical protein
VQTVAPSFQGVSKHTQCSTIVLKQELAIWLGIQQVSLVFWLGASPRRRRAIPPPLERRGLPCPISVIESGDSPGLSLEEAGYVLGRIAIEIGDGFATNYLDGDLPLDARIFGKVNLTHAATANQAQQVITAYVQSI